MENLSGVGRIVAGGLLGLAGLTGGCSFRDGNERISVTPIIIPFIGGAIVKEQVIYEEGTNNVIGRFKIDASVAFGCMHMDISKYGKDGKFEERCKVRYDNVMSGNPKISTEIYDENGRKVRTIDGVPDNLPRSVRRKMPY